MHKISKCGKAETNSNLAIHPSSFPLSVVGREMRDLDVTEGKREKGVIGGPDILKFYKIRIGGIANTQQDRRPDDWGIENKHVSS
ncbi:hypothetical protein Tco_0210279 [Tanacetum coccineum]